MHRLIGFYINEKIVERLLFIDPRTKEKINDGKDMQFYRKQVRIALKNCGVINPEDIDDYIIHDGYKAVSYTHLPLFP